jgi:hypothetical protein
MALFTFWSGDHYEAPEKTSNVSIGIESDVTVLSSLMNLDEQRIRKRFEEGNEAWIVKLDGTPVSFGWVGRRLARIGELSKEVEVPIGSSYLWNFRTLEPHRGKGYYVQLLRTILKSEESISQRIWIISAPENQSSYNGIVKAGFQPVGDIMFDHNNEVVLSARYVNERTQAGADFVQIPITTSAVRPCWRCASKAMKKDVSCDCYENSQPCCCGNPHPVQNKAMPTVTNIL